MNTDRNLILSPLPEARPPYFALLLISAAALAFEVLLMRLFSIIQWHHFAYMIISLALLGYGASGTLMSIFGDRLAAHFTTTFAACSLLFGSSALGCFLITQQLPFNTLEIAWNLSQWGYLLLSYLLLFTPFFFAALCIGLSFIRFKRCISKIYAFDLIGAGCGALGVILLMRYFTPTQILQWVAALGFGAAALVSLGKTAPGYRFQSAILVLLAILIGGLPPSFIQLNQSPYKPLQQMLQVKGARLVQESFSPLGMISLIENPLIPLRIAEGLSLNSSAHLPAQLGLFLDGELIGALNRYQGDRRTLAWLDQQTSALPYHLSQPQRVLSLGLGGGGGILQGIYHNASNIEVVEDNRKLIEIVRDTYGDYTGWRHFASQVQLHSSQPRSFMSASSAAYDLIQISLVDGAGAGSGGVYGLNENYLYTSEAISQYLSRLTPGGMLAITRWINLPPRDGIKLLATVTAGLRLSGIQDNASRLLFIRGWKTSTLIVKNGPVEAVDIDRARRFSAQRSFDLIYYPGIQQEEVNRHNLLPLPYFHQGAKALLGDEANKYIDRYKFDIRPARDDRPFFFDFFRWRTLPEILSLFHMGGMSLLELGYPILILTLAQALLLSIILLLLPLMSMKRRHSNIQPSRLVQTTGYFLVIGLSYMLIEMAFIQKFVLFLDHPIYSVAILLCGFLVFSGIGSGFVHRLKERNLSGTGLLLLMLVIGALALANLWAMPLLFTHFADLSLVSKTLLTLAMISPLAFFMGMPFPIGLTRIATQSPQLTPWAWGTNGFASLLGAIVATLLAIHIGFQGVVVIAVMGYVVAGLFAQPSR